MKYPSFFHCRILSQDNRRKSSPRKSESLCLPSQGPSILTPQVIAQRRHSSRSAHTKADDKWNHLQNLGNEATVAFPASLAASESAAKGT